MDSIETSAAKFSSDYFFHYLLHHCDEVRNLFVSHLSDHPILNTELTVADFYQRKENAKKRILDVAVVDDQGYYYDLEMQNGDINRSEMIRFFNYASLLLDSQINKGKDYNVKTVKTLIIYTGKSIRDLEHFEHRFELIDSDYLIKLKDGPIEIEILQIERMEELGMEVVNNDQFYRIVHMFSKNEDFIDHHDDELYTLVLDHYNKYLNSDEYIANLQIERDRRAYHTGMIQSRKEGVEEGKILGKQEGIEEGIRIGKEEGYEVGIRLGREEGRKIVKQKEIEEGRRLGKEEGILEVKRDCVLMIFKKEFPYEDTHFLENLSIEQYDAIMKLLSENGNLEQIYEVCHIFL